MPEPLPTTVLSAIDPVLRDSTAAAVVLDVPGAVALSYAMGPHGIHRTVSDIGGILEEEDVFLEHACLNCALRLDVIPTLQRLADIGRWRAAVLALPVGAEPVAVSEALGSATVDVRLASVVSIADAATLEDDVLGDELLADRGHGLTDDDQRAVGEALSHQIEYADVVISATPAEGHPSGHRLLEHLRSEDSIHWAGLHEMDAGRLFGHHHDPARSARRIDPRHIRPPAPSARAGDHAWTIDLHSTRPFHPQRLMDSIEELATGRVRARGRFWLPSRPHTLCLWDGAGGQLAIGDGGPWGAADPDTRLVVTGTGDERRRLRKAFQHTLMTSAEMAAQEARWAGADDGFAPWLGEQSSAA